MKQEDYEKVLLYSDMTKYGEFDGRPNLFMVDLKDADLSNLDLSNAYLICSDLNGALLVGTNLSGANLYGCTFQNTRLDDAELYCATFTATVFEDKTKQLKKALRTTLQPNGGLILYRTRWSKYHRNITYRVGKTYKANAFSRCPVTECHPGIYGMPLSGLKEKYPYDQYVKIYVPMGEWHFVSEDKGFRCRRIRVLEECE